MNLQILNSIENEQNGKMLSSSIRRNLSDAELKVKNRFSALTNRNGEVVRVLNEQEQIFAFFDHYSLKHARALILNEAKDTCFSTRYYKPETPTLTMASNIYGAIQLSNWVQDNLLLVAENTGTKGQWTPMQMEIVANMLVEKFNSGTIHLNMREVLLFFYQWMSGKYGHFYGSADIQLIGQAADAFLEYRHNEICRIEREQEEKERNKRFEAEKKHAATKSERKEALLKGLKEHPENVQMLLSLGWITKEELIELGLSLPEREKSEEEKRKEHERVFRELLKKQ